MAATPIGGDAPTAPAHSFVARMHASLRALASPPGRLTADWIAGKRVGYVAPLSLFLWVNVAFFLVQSATRLGILTWPLSVHLDNDFTGPAAGALLAWQRPFLSTPDNALAVAFDALEGVHAKSLVLIMVPAFASVLSLLLMGRHRFKDSLVFATHFYTFALIWLSTLFPIVAITLRMIVASGTPMPAHHNVDLVVTALEAAVLAWYLGAALRTVYGLRTLRRVVTTVALVAAMYCILVAYHLVVFAATLYSM